MLKKTLLYSLSFWATLSFAQRGINNNYTASGTVTVNAYTSLTLDAPANTTSITVGSNTLTSAALTAPLTAGDLILIIQMQGADMDVNTTPTSSWGGDYTLSNGAMADLANLNNYRDEWGAVTNYNNAGKYEYAQVLSISSGTVINLNCGLKNSYTAAGHVQIVRVPRFNNLTLNAGATIVPATWNGTIGGVVALEVNGVLTFNAGSKISASSFGFRGGATDPSPSGGPAGSATEVGKPGTSTANKAAEKGEGICGSPAGEYQTIYLSRYGMGAAGNGGGGGNYRNAGGGGGSNIGSGTYTGYGVPNPTYASSWNAELVGMSSAPSSGGGRGGYSLATSDQNELTLGPNQTAWAGDYRRTEGGLGGHPLTYDATRVFMGGGGGSGEQDGDQAGAGGKGGGIVFIQSYGTIVGTGIIESTGENGQKSNPANQTAGAGVKKGNDGAGGGGAGGSVIISNAAAIPSTVTINVSGGAGGNDALIYGNFASGLECNGPGGGGAGGFVNYTTGSPTLNLVGGTNGIVQVTGNTNIVSNFPPNGATSGAAGTNLANQPFFDITVPNASICSNTSTTLTATVVGTLPAGATIGWYTAAVGGTLLGTGTSFTTPSLSSTTTYYVGTCPGTFRIPVTVTVGAPTISGTAVITNATCSTPGSITGLTTSGGAAPITITWNTLVTPTMNLNNASAGTYTVVVTDNAGCTASSGPYTVTGVAGPVINATNLTVTNESCLGNDGAVTGITATGSGLSYAWTNTTQTTLNLSNLAAGSYTLTVTDNNGCIANYGPVNVGANPGPSINTASMVVTNGTCGNANGSITGITALGNGLSYSWTSTSQTTLNISNLSAGSYTLTVTDNLGCTAISSPISVTSPSGPTLTTTALATTPDHCNQSDGTISGITVSGGTTPYVVTYNGTTYPGLDITSLSAGNYNLVVTDNAGCSANFGPIVISAVAGPSINTTAVIIQNETCAGNDGSITGITATGTGLTYQWNLTPSAGANLNNAAAGNYALLVTDQFGCTAAAGPYTISGATPLVIDSTNLIITNAGCIVNNGAINGLQINGGVNPQISWSNNAPTLNNTNLAAGTYTLTVTDDQGCSVVADFTVGSLSGPVINVSSVVIADAHCSQEDGSISGITVSNGTAPYTYMWDNDPTLNTITLMDVAPGIHTLLVADASGCTDQVTITIGNIPGPVINTGTLQVNNATCLLPNGDIGGLTVTGNGPYTYLWLQTGANTINLTNIPAGNYTLQVTDVFGCITTGNPILVNTTPNPFADFTFSPDFIIPNQEVTFVDNTTGANVDAYEWYADGVLFGTNSSATNTYLEAGTYEVELVVSTINGCQDSITKTIVVSGDIIIPNVITSNNDGVNDLFEIKNLKPNSKLLITNRWGILIFETENYLNNWGGKNMAGDECTEGVYFYQLLTVDGKSWQGTVNLLKNQ